jgi:hypothetical protein
MLQHLLARIYLLIPAGLLLHWRSTAAAGATAAQTSPATHLWPVRTPEAKNHAHYTTKTPDTLEKPYSTESRPLICRKPACHADDIAYPAKSNDGA